MIQEKIIGHTAKASVEKQVAFKLFGRPRDGITYRHFRKQLGHWGVELSKQDAIDLFKRYDVES